MNKAVAVGDDGNPPGDDDGPLLAALKEWFADMRAGWQTDMQASLLQAEQARMLATPVPVPLTQAGTVPASGAPLVLDLGAPQLGRRWLTRLITAAGGATLGAASATSQSAQGSVTNPGTFAAIAFSNSVPAGTYQVTATVYLSGTVTGADANNMQLTGTGTGTVHISYPGVANSPVTITANMTSTAAGGIGIQTIAAASGASAVYNATVVVTPLTGASSVAGTADFYVGQPPGPGGSAPTSGWRWRFTTLPGAENFSSEQLPVIPTDHLYCVVTGAAAGTGVVACAIVLDYPVLSVSGISRQVV